MGASRRAAKEAGRAAVVLLSGGLDSATVLAMACEEGFACHAVSFDYGQRHGVELRAAKRVAKALGAASHRVVRVDMRGIGGSALTSDLAVPKGRSAKEMDGGGIPVTYVPARNTIFLSYGLAVAEVMGAGDVFIGVNAVDYSGYPDCRPEFIEAFERVANLATKAAVEGRDVTIHAPLIHWPKPRIIRRGLELGVDYSLTHSCYDPKRGGKACGRCDACLLRKRAFEELGMRDPVLGE